MKIKYVIFLFMTCFTTIGCSSIGRLNPESSFLGGDRVTTSSANQMFNPNFEGFTDEQLLQLLDPDNNGLAAAYIQQSGTSVGAHQQNDVGAIQEKQTGDNLGEKNKKYSELSDSEKIKALRVAFRNANVGYDLAHRAQIQDRLVAASNQRCNLYTTYLKRISTYQNGVFGTLTTMLGGAGAIVTGEDTARLLSGLAGISSGTRAELNQAIFESIATSVIIPGIQNTRSDLLTAIMNKRSMPLSEYTIEGAIADAIKYHGACSMDTGISYAQKSIQSFDDIGIKRFTGIQNELGIARSASEAIAIGPLASLVVTGKKLDDFKNKLNTEYKNKINFLKKDENFNLIEKYESLEKSTTTDGDLRNETIRLDEELTSKMFDYAHATGAQKTDKFSLLESQQIMAKDFVRKIEAINAEFLVELKGNVD